MSTTAQDTESSEEKQGGGVLGTLAAGIMAVLVGGFVVVVLALDAWGSSQACAAGASPIDPASVPEGPVAGYGHEQLVNAAIIAKVAADRNMPARAQLIGVMTAMGESSLVNIGYGDDINGVTNPDGSPTCSLGLFQQQWCLGWGTREQVMDPVYASNAFFDRLVTVNGWEDLEPTIAINRTQGNADPYHYARYEADAGEILAAIGGAKPGAGCVGDGQWTSSFDTTANVTFSDVFGMRDASITGYAYLHSGIDLATASGTPMLAASGGTVKSVDTVDDSAEGMNVKITHSDGVETQYLHMSKVLVKEGDVVTGGQLIGDVGNTGRSYGAHLHLSILVDGEFVDPLPFLQARGVDYCTIATPENAKVANVCRK